MSMNAVSDKSRNIGAGVMLGTAGMGAYFLPVTKDRFVRNAFCIKKELTEDKIDRFTESAGQIVKNNLSTSNKMFLKEEGIAENIDEISKRCQESRKSITDSDVVQNLKKSFEDNFQSYKKSEAMMDNIASDAFKRIRWTNFGWGIGIVFLIGSALSALSSKSQN